MNFIKVDIDKEGGQISIFNNGKGIPIEMHNDQKIYVHVPQLHLTNYDDKKKMFLVVVMFRNMIVIEQPIITACPKGEYTVVRFSSLIWLGMMMTLLPLKKAYIRYGGVC
ncbi:19433_t:CDS:2 [Funneliformis geosporum]|uniref:14831_t:CDS:1 n=1 Tax=Funneliformis geosporum TaxID=1117311 RepID=A0A9W4SVL5_9GLOM|nr:19433_t:CDS:2 [Funneliformis geosporum]CAI2183166.1 14831_t:CDS:2 [Funneliformis geosporum]